MNVLKTKQFEKDFRNLPIQMKSLVADVYEDILSAQTLYEVDNCKRLKGSTDRYRIRVGGYRILFLLVVIEKTIVLRRVAPRGQAYKKSNT